MNTPDSVRPNSAAKTPPSEDDSRPISISVVVLISDARKSTRVLARRGQAFATAPEALAALPGNLHSLVRGAGGDAQIELNKFLRLLAEPEPAVEEPPPACACPVPSMCVVQEPETPVAELPSAPAPNPAPSPDDYAPPLSLSLLGTLP